jgi:hypothetical protein
MTDFPDRADLLREIEDLRARLKTEQEETAQLRWVLFMQFEKQSRISEMLASPVSDRAADLFEALPDTFSLDQLFDAAETIEMDAAEAVEHVKTYLAEEMLEQVVASGRFRKTGYRPY